MFPVREKSRQFYETLNFHESVSVNVPSDENTPCLRIASGSLANAELVNIDNKNNAVKKFFMKILLLFRVFFSE